jgi:hypothetical protein
VDARDLIEKNMHYWVNDTFYLSRFLKIHGHCSMCHHNFIYYNDIHGVCRALCSSTIDLRHIYLSIPPDFSLSVVKSQAVHFWQTILSLCEQESVEEKELCSRIKSAPRFVSRMVQRLNVSESGRWKPPCYEVKSCAVDFAESLYTYYASLLHRWCTTLGDLMQRVSSTTEKDNSSRRRHIS